MGEEVPRGTHDIRCDALDLQYNDLKERDRVKKRLDEPQGKLPPPSDEDGPLRPPIKTC